ncbi:MAG: branched-chain amino acid ABC transporter permease [candidate division NC10 bacterium RIFCSPLOWO2_12_FULL_66_18]|nr:MAG: branched-chain amino acid ABC transporter permease [candidate division NC10 bacterium RIFCSPLOWO2_02_FULL_66_22]OGB96702.1 MAG: branched-chain amino acid ABC transporter permease [candidate division NC10 bacterium RIFCSPLOWO2_12_FULL_66_18]
MVYALVALGLSLIYSGLDIVHFAHGEIYMIGAFIGLMLFRHLGIGYVPTLLLAVVLTGIVGVLIERVFYRRLTSTGGGYTVAGMGMIIAGFGMSIVLQNVAYLIWGPKALPFPVPYGRPVEIGNLALPMSYVWIVATALILMFVLNLLLKKTMIGLAIRAVAHNKDIAYLSGVNVPLMISLIFGIGCALGAAAGVLIGPINYVQVLMGLSVLIKAFAAAVVGGFGSLPGAVLGGVLVGVIESLGAGYVSGTYKDTYAFVLLIFVLMVKPSGILGVEAKVKA